MYNSWNYVKIITVKMFHLKANLVISIHCFISTIFDLDNWDRVCNGATEI